MTSETIFYLILGVYIFHQVFNSILEYLNIGHSKKPVNPLLDGMFTVEKKEKADAYFREKARFSMNTEYLSFVIILILLLTSGFSSISEYVGQYTADPIYHALLFFGVMFLASEIVGIPFELYMQFRIEEKYGFNKMDVKLFFMDKLKGYLLGGIIGGGIFYLLLSLIMNLQQDFWIYFLAVVTVLILLINMFYTSVIMPLFNKLTPLEDGSLRDKITEYSKKIDFPLDNIFVVDGSKRSTKANAFFSGIGQKKKIVLYDTLVDQLEEEEIVAVLAHEVGHFKKKHIVMNIFQSIFFIGMMLFVLSRFIFSPELSQAMGSEGLSIHLNLLAFSFLYSPISTLLEMVTTLLSRKNEFEADAYAKDTYSGEKLVEALKKLSISNLSNLNPHPAYVFFNYSHPTVLQRFQKLRG